MNKKCMLQGERKKCYPSENSFFTQEQIYVHDNSNPDIVNRASAHLYINIGNVLVGKARRPARIPQHPGKSGNYQSIGG
jgi:hypothetical protein